MTAIRAFTPSSPPCNIRIYNGLDEEGCYYYNARWYDASTGRFISEDPARDGSNWHVYVGNNPLKFVDPTGLRRQDGDDDDDDRDRKQRQEERRQKREERQRERDERRNRERHDPDQGLPDATKALLTEVLGESALGLIDDANDFTGVVMVGTMGHASAIASGAYEVGEGYIVKNGQVQESFEYESISLGFESNGGVDGGEVLTVIPGGTLENAFGESFTTGVSAGYGGLSGGANLEVIPTGDSEIHGYSYSYNVGPSLSPLDVSAHYNYTWERK